MIIVAKETMRAKIERLESENKANLALIERLNHEISSMQEKADQDFANSSFKKQLEDQIAFQTSKAKTYEKRTEQEKVRNTVLFNQIDELQDENKRLKADLSMEKNKAYKRPHNERNAGRRPKITEKQIAEIQMLRAQGLTLQKIQKETGLTYGLVQKHSKAIKS